MSDAEALHILGTLASTYLVNVNPNTNKRS